MTTTVTEGLYCHCESLSLAEIHWMVPFYFFPNDCVLEEEEECYRLNRVLPKLIRWSPKPQYFRMWLDFEIGPLKRWLSQNETFRWALIQSDQCPHRWGYLDTQGNIRDTWTQSKEHVTTQWEGGHLLAKERGLRRNQICQQHDLGLLASRDV